MTLSWHNTPHSSAIQSVAYDSDHRLVYVAFKKGGVWQYENCTQGTYYEMVSAPSVGKYYNRNVKPLDSRKVV